MPDSEKVLAEKFLMGYHKLLYSSHATASESRDTLEEFWLVEVLKNSIVMYWKMRTDSGSEPPEFLIELIDYVENHSAYWFSYTQERWLE